MGLQFDDGVSFDDEALGGPLKAVEKHDGWYVAGCGILVPVNSREDAEAFISKRDGDRPAEVFVSKCSRCRRDVVRKAGEPALLVALADNEKVAVCPSCSVALGGREFTKEG